MGLLVAVADVVLACLPILTVNALPCAKDGVGRVESFERCKFFHLLHCFIYVASDLADLVLNLRPEDVLAKCKSMLEAHPSHRTS